MENVAIDDVGSHEFGDDAAVRDLADRLDATDLALNHYRIPPGEGFPSGLHAHGDQEEVFVVLDGAATFETLAPERDDAEQITVSAGEAIRFAPGRYQSGRNDGDSELVALALGAPGDSEDVRVPLDCPECGHEYLRPEAGAEGVTLVCPDCGTANVPEGCPDCGAEMRVSLGEGSETIVACPECGAEAESPFWR